MTGRGSVVVAGGSGFLGRALVSHLAALGFEPVTLTRGGEAAPPPAGRVARWDGRSAGPWEREVAGARAVVNLAGAPIEGLWTPAKRRAIRESRLDATRALVAACTGAAGRPALFLQGSAVGFYGPAGEGACDETAPAGAGFLAEVARDWEEASSPAEALGIRRAILRTGLVIDPSGGIAGRLLPLFRLGLGGSAGDGRRPFPWIALRDAVSAIAHLVARDGLAGPFNLVAPGRATADDFTRALTAAAGRPAFLRAPAFLLRAALGEQADDLLLSGRDVRPARLTAAGFRFAVATLGEALAALR